MRLVYRWRLTEVLPLVISVGKTTKRKGLRPLAALCVVDYRTVNLSARQRTALVLEAHGTKNRLLVLEFHTVVSFGTLSANHQADVRVSPIRTGGLV